MKLMEEMAENVTVLEAHGRLDKHDGPTIR
jgi:hypothetical protein